MKYCLKVIKKDNSISNYYFSSYEELDYNATFLQFCTNVTEAIGLTISLFENKTLFKITSL